MRGAALTWPRSRPSDPPCSPWKETEGGRGPSGVGLSTAEGGEEVGGREEGEGRGWVAIQVMDDEAPVGSEVRDKATDEKCHRGLDPEICVFSWSPCALFG